MEKTVNDLVINLSLRGEIKPYFVDAEFDIEFESDEDLDPWIKSLEVTKANIVDRYDDSWQLEIVPDKNNSLYCDIIKDIEVAINHLQGNDLCNEWLLEREE